MGHKVVYFLPIIGLTIVLGGCGRPFSEDEMLIRELRFSKEEIAALNQELEQVQKEKETLKRQVQQLQDQLTEHKKNQNQAGNPTTDERSLKSMVFNHEGKQKQNP